MLGKLSMVYDEREAKAIFHYYIEHKLGIPKYQYYLNTDILFSEKEWEEIVSDILFLEKAFPVQYLCGYTYFFGLKLFTKQGVLIPRPETEELVQIIIKEQKDKKQLKIVDIGTGSGAIAIALAKHLPSAEIIAIDNSEKALELAVQNADIHKVNIQFFLHDFLSDDSSIFENADILVSNPPYIPEKEKDGLHKNVIHFEPHSALFVPDKDPLLYYRKIAETGKVYLQREGRIYLETHENFHDKLFTMFSAHGFQEVKKMRDLSGRPRMMVVIKH